MTNKAETIEDLLENNMNKDEEMQPHQKTNDISDQATGYHMIENKEFGASFFSTKQHNNWFKSDESCDNLIYRIPKKEVPNCTKVGLVFTQDINITDSLDFEIDHSQCKELSFKDSTHHLIDCGKLMHRCNKRMRALSPFPDKSREMFSPLLDMDKMEMGYQSNIGQNKATKATGKTIKLKDIDEDHKFVEKEGWAFSPISPFNQNVGLEKLNKTKVQAFSNDDRESDLDTKMPPIELQNMPEIYDEENHSQNHKNTERRKIGKKIKPKK